MTCSSWPGSQWARHEIRLERDLQRDVLAQQAPEELLAGAHGLVDVHGDRRDGLLARKGQQLPGEVASPIGRVGDLLHHVHVGGPPLAGLLLQRLGAAHDHREEVVEVVGHPTGELADGLHLGGLMDGAQEPVAIRLGSPQIRDVTGHGEDELLAANRDHPRREEAGRELPVPLAELRLQVPDAVVTPEPLDQPPMVLRGVPDPDVQGGASEDLGRRPPGELREAVVHGQVGAVAQPIQAQGVGTGLECDAEALLALPERFLGANAVRDVPEDRAPVLLAPRRGDQGGRELDRKGRAVASPEPKLARRGTRRLPFGEHGGKRRVVHHHSGSSTPPDLRLRHAKRAAGGWIGSDHRPV